MSFSFNKEKLVFEKYCVKGNIGNISSQIVLFTFRINKLQKHFSIYKKDLHSKRGLLNLVFKRRKLLNYLKIKNFDLYKILLNELNLRY